jgi:two-component system sensor histidine kinase PilS (NtrC family)
MDQGVVVVDAETRVRANNRASRVLIGLNPDAQLTGERLSSIDRLAPLVAAFNRWRGSDAEADARGANTAELPDLRLRARFVQPTASQSDEFLIFIEDLRALDERAQQLKLASMGRLTASIAHEIRNPLAAISHASQLLVEDSQEPGLKRLAAIVRENTLRLNRLVEDILRVARREAPVGDRIELAAFLEEWRVEFVRDRPAVKARLQVSASAGVEVRFELSHLRQVVYNLVDNALRYASESTGAVRILVETSPAATLWVVDDGPGVSETLRNSLFEPFNTTHVAGTGLGLYIAREFCVANRSRLAYDEIALPDGSRASGFVIRFSMEELEPLEADYLDTMVPND